MQDLIDAIKNGDIETAQQLLEQGADVKAPDNEGKTPLHWAADEGHEAIIECLVEAKADLNAQDKNGQTPLHWAATGGYESIVAYLVKRNVKVDAQDIWGRTPLHWAAGRGYEAIVAYLIDKGADVQARDDCGQTPMHWAAARGHQTTIASLVEKGADVDVRNNVGQTPMHWAAARGHQTTVAYFIEQSADVNVRDNESRTPLHFAVSFDHIAIAQLLLAQGVYHERDLDTEKTFLSWIEDWKMQGSMDEEGILCVITMLLAGVPIDDDALPERLKAVKTRIYQGMEQWLTTLLFSFEALPTCIPSVLRALPEVIRLTGHIHDSKGPSIVPGYDSDDLKRYFFRKDETLNKECKSFFEALQKAEIPTELVLIIRESLRDREIVENLEKFYSLDHNIMDAMWCKGELHVVKCNQPLQLDQPVERDGSILMKLWDTKIGCILQKIPQILKHQRTETLQERISPRP